MISVRKINKSAIALALLGTGFSMPTLAQSVGTEMVNPEAGVVLGFWHNWCGGGGYQGGVAPCFDLESINPMYNVVAVSFMKVYDTAEGRIPTFRLDPSIGMSEAEFIKQIKTLNDQGRTVLISLGGADAHIELKRGDEQALATEIIRLTDTYGFDGLDIDLEQAAVTASDNQWVIPEALKMVKDHYRVDGKNFIISMAPEFPYLKQGDKYVPYLERLEGYYDWVNPQFYNQGGDGLWVDEENAWITQNNDAMKEKFIYYISDSLSNGTRGFHKIPHDKLVFGIPSNPDAAATGFIKDPQALYNAFDAMKAKGQPLRGVMTWSINWDLGTDSAGKPYNSAFINAYGPYIHGQESLPPVQGKPMFSGLNDVRVAHGSEFDPMAGVKAMDKEDGDLTSSIGIDGVVNTQVLGTTILIYNVVDSDGNVAQQARSVEVYSARPEFSGVNNTTIKLGEAFDPLAGVKAIDAEDGDLTRQIRVQGSVNSNKLGKYTLTYSVSDSAEQTVSVNRVITVADDSVVCSNAWDPKAVYLADEVVSHTGQAWTAAWWTQGEEPGTTGEWGVWRPAGESDCAGGSTPDQTPDQGVDLIAKITGLQSEYRINGERATVSFNVETNAAAQVEVTLLSSAGFAVNGGEFQAQIKGVEAITLSLSGVEQGTYALRLQAENGDGEVEQRYNLKLVDSAVDSDIPAYVAGTAYQAGDQVLGADGNVYQCKPWPYTGWCASASYAPGDSLYWADAWDKL